MEKGLYNPDCAFCDSPYCALLNQKNCKKCCMSKLEPEEQIKAGEDIFFVAEALPENGLEDIMNAKECAICRPGEDEAPGEAQRYAQFDMGHIHPLVPADQKENGRYKRAASMVIPVQLPVCDDCRHKLNLLYYLPLGIGVLIAALGLVATSLEAVRIPLTRYGRIIPFLVFLISVCIGVIVACIVNRMLRRRIERSMNTRAKRIPALSELVKNGWFPIGRKDGMISFSFTKEKLDSGLLTGENQREALEKIRGFGREGVALVAENTLKRAEREQSAE